MNVGLRVLLAEVLLFLLSLTIPLVAQDYARHEITVSADIQSYGFETCVPINGGPQCSPGIAHYLNFPAASFTYDYNLSPSLAIEGSVIPTTPFIENNGLTAGRETLALGGVKTGRRGERWGLYGDVKVGAASFSCGTWNYAPKPYSNCGRLTNFALLYSGVVERRLGRRWALRLDAGHLLMPEFDDVLERSANFEVGREGRLIQHLDARLGVTRSFGVLRGAEHEATPSDARWDAGIMFALQPRTLPTYPIMDAYPAWGIWGSWNFSKHVSWDSAVLHSGRNTGPSSFADYQAGGRSLEALTGVKIGIRRDRMGYFGKIRGGTITFGETERQIWVKQRQFGIDRGMFTNPVLDVGGVLEVYPSRHTILRFDAGSATIFYQPKDVYAQFVKYPIPGETQVTMLIGFGAGWRF